MIHITKIKKKYSNCREISERLLAFNFIDM